MDSRLEQLKQRLRNPLGTLAKGDGGGAYQQAVQQGRQRAEEHGGGAYLQAVQHVQYMAEPPRISGGQPQLGQEYCNAEAGAAAASSSRDLSASSGQEQPQGAAVVSQERECDEAQEGEEEEARDWVLREMEGDMFDFEADLAAEEDD